jgi:hypothetical protein
MGMVFGPSPFCIFAGRNDKDDSMGEVGSDAGTIPITTLATCENAEWGHSLERSVPVLTCLQQKLVRNARSSPINFSFAPTTNSQPHDTHTAPAGSGNCCMRAT